MKQVMEKVINQVTDKKAEADIIVSTSKSLKMSSFNAALSEYKVSSSQIMGVRVIKDQKVGISYTEAFDDESLKLMVKQALDNAENSETQLNQSLLELSGTGHDDAHYPEEEVSIADKTKRAIELETKVKAKDKRVTAVPYNSYGESEGESFYLSSKGRFTTFSDKSYNIVSSALMENGDRKENFYDFHSSHTYNGLEWDRVVENSLFHAANLLDGRKLPTGKYEVMFDPDQMTNLIGCFTNFYSAKAGIDKVNPWISKLGEQVVSKDLSFEDRPLFERSYRVSKFDSEGVERKNLHVVKDGILNSFYHNSMTARFFNTKTTGHASRGPGSSLDVYGTTFCITGKNKKSKPAKYIEIIDMAGLHSGANRVTGDFSMGVQGYLWENGERVHAFSGVTLSGNLIKMLNNVDVVGDELLGSRGNNFFTVPLIFHDLSVAGL